ncbi:linoleate diol synthase [Cyathus striatus]|nr:linoleate diol synthase [Cyathus striatus]
MSLNRMSSIFKRSQSESSMTNGTVSHVVDKEYQHTEVPAELKDFRDRIKKGLPLNLSTSSVSSIIDLIRHKGSIDDRKLFLEHALSFISKLEEGTPIAILLKNKVVELLYNDLTHPPATSVGTKYAWRTADGSYNNPDVPDLGKAGTPYSRSVQQTHPLPKNQLPDPGLIFDTLLKRDGFVKHPGGLSSLMFSFAPLVIHSVFRTSHYDPNINETSSYVDLAPLYGNNQDEQDRVRVRDGRDRLLLLPPAVCAILVLFNRNHNYIAKKLLEINERGAYEDPSNLKSDDPASKAKLLAQEEEIFQTARLVNASWFAAVVFTDYFSTILGLVRDGNSWSLTPFDEIRKEDHSLFERGKGNVCSVEFNCLYRWHSTTSIADQKWTESVFNQLFEGKSPEDLTAADFKMIARKAQAQQPDLSHWTFGRLQRQPDGTFKDEDLAAILQNATEEPAAAFRARGTPEVMRLNEVMGIEMNRRWGVCSLNDFRRYLGLKPYSSFIEWNSDTEIAYAAEKLYGDIEYLELYVGLQAEEAKPLVDGAGLCPGYTISRAILSDAIALTRGDRFYTHDFTPYNLTAWGFADCQRDPKAYGFGSTLGRLLLRTLPNDYTEKSVYTFFPLMTPEMMKKVLKKLDLLDAYDLSRPTPSSSAVVVKDYAQISGILSDKASYSATYSRRVSRVIKGFGFFTAESSDLQKSVIQILNGSPEMVSNISQYFYESTQKLITANSFAVVGGGKHGVDLVRDVLKALPTYWAATDLAGIQLKTVEHPDGVYTPLELFDILGEIYSYIFLDVEASKVMVLENKVKKHVKDLLELIHDGLSVGNRLSFAGIFDSVSSLFSKPKKSQHHEIVKRLYEVGHSTDQLANTILALMVGSTELTLALTNMVNLYLDTEYEADVRRLATSSTVKAGLEGYAYEALRLDPPFRGVYRLASKDGIVHGQSVKTEQRVFLDISDANRNPTVFTAADKPNPSRPSKDTLNADGLFKCFGENLTIKIMSQVLRAVFSYENLGRAPGQSGSLQRFQDETRLELAYGYLDRDQHISEWPRSFTVQYTTAK